METLSRHLRWGVIILAAGASRRMGKAKMLLPWERTTVLGHVIALGRQLPRPQVTVVIAAGATDILVELRRVRLPASAQIINPNPSRGMFSSVRCAAQWEGWRPHLTHWMIMLGDQPHLQPRTVRLLGKFAAEHPQSICQPARRSRPRHPVVLPAAAFRDLAASAHPTLRHFLNAHANEVKLLEIDDPAVDSDLDTPEDYQRLITV
ncbi:MAG: nucleotidyltransferase family protein [Verrucomicrobiales bacterium]